MRLSAFLLIPVVVVLMGCGGGGTSGATPGLTPAPTNLQASFNPTTNQVTLTWTQAGGSVDGYYLEASISNQTYAQVNTTPIAPQSYGVTITFTGPPPEQTTWEFRARARTGNSYSAYSNVATIQNGINQPLAVTATQDTINNQMRVVWVPNSLVADHTLVERASQPTGPWTRVATPAVPQRLVKDVTIAENASYYYRATNLVAAKSSVPTVSDMINTRDFSPEQFTAQASGSGVQLTWNNAGSTHGQVGIARFTPGNTLSPFVYLPTTITSYFDGAPTPGLSLYCAEYTYGYSPVIAVAVGNPAGALNLTGTGIWGPLTIGAALAQDGSWILQGTDMVEPSAGSPWPVSPYLGSFGPMDPMGNFTGWVQSDSSNHPHFLFRDTTSDSTADWTLNHAWWDGNSWQGEAIADWDQLRPPGMGLASLQADLDPDGGLQGLADVGTSSFPLGGSTTTLNYIHEVNGTWTVDSLAGLVPRIDNFQACHFALDLHGSPHLLVGKDNTIEEYVGNPDGSWASRVIPTGPAITLDCGTCLTGAWADGNNGWLVCESDSNGGTRSIYVLQESGGVYGAPALLGTNSNQEGLDGTCLAALPDRSAIAVVGNTSQGLSAFTKVNGVWTATLVCPTSYSNYAGFDASGQLHILIGKRPAGALVEYH